MAKRKKMTADEKADQKFKYYQSLENKYQKRWKNSEQKGMDTYNKMKATKDKKEKAKLKTRWKKITKVVGAENNARKHYQKLRKNALFLKFSRKMFGGFGKKPYLCIAFKKQVLHCFNSSVG